MRQPIARGLAVFVTCAAVFALGALSRVPYTPADAENGVLRVSWRARGERVTECRRLTPEELEALPLHMRRPEACEGRIAPYRLRVSIDGAVVADTVIRPAGARQDRPIYVLRDIALAPGEYAVDVAFAREGAPAHLALQAVVEIRPGEIALVTYDPARNALVLRTAQDRERSGS